MERLALATTEKEEVRPLGQGFSISLNFFSPNLVELDQTVEPEINLNDELG